MKPFRRWIANHLARLARRIYPQSEEAMSFYMDRMVDFALTGQSGIKISYVAPEDMYVSPTSTPTKAG